MFSSWEKICLYLRKYVWLPLHHNESWAVWIHLPLLAPNACFVFYICTTRAGESFAKTFVANPEILENICFLLSDRQTILRVYNQQGTWHNRDSCVWLILLGHDGRHFADNIFRCIFVNEKLRIVIKISLKFVPNGPIDNINPALIGLDNGLAPNMRHAIIWTNADPIHRRIYAALGEVELTSRVG